MSEWGNPLRANSQYHRLNKIGRLEPTGGTETSKYPQERKVITTPSVAASERGISLNRVRVKAVTVAHAGSWDIAWRSYGAAGKLQSLSLAESSGKRSHRG